MSENTHTMQGRLFDSELKPGHYHVHSLGDAEIREYPMAFSSFESNNYLNKLISSVTWEQASIAIAGKTVPVPRLQCWMGDPQASYGYSGLRLKPGPWQQPVNAIRARVSELTGHDFNSVLLNYYRDGQDSVAWHADDEAELGPEPVIASVSFGAERVFQLKHKFRADAPRHRLLLLNGSLLLMGKTMQNNWLHQIPKTKSAVGPRVNLTFRTIIQQAR